MGQSDITLARSRGYRSTPHSTRADPALGVSVAEAQARLAAIIESSDDAIISKSLDRDDHELECCRRACVRIH